MGGRIDDIAVSESDPSIIYLGYAVGGVFKSDNNGTTFKPVFETYGTASIGDIAIHPTNPDIVYVGTGEPNNRQTSSFGDGIYKTTDGGKTFTNIGLKDTQTIARIVIDPKNPETVYVASPGHLFGPNPERGIFKTTDGGKTWNKVKFIDDDTGFTDIAIDPSNTNILYAASYQRRRSGCCFNGGGPGSALWKTTDAGKTWTKLTANGLPPGTYGRIALDVVAFESERRLRADRSRPTSSQPRHRASDRSGREHRSHAARGGGGTVAGRQPASDAAGGRPWNARTATAGWPTRRRSGCHGRPRARRVNYDWCNNAGPDKGFARGRGGQTACAESDAAAARHRTRRHLPLREQGRRLGARQQLQLAADVLQPASRRSEQRQGRLRGGPSGREIARRRQDVRDPRRRLAGTASRATSTSTRSGSIRRTRSTS